VENYPLCHQLHRKYGSLLFLALSDWSSSRPFLVPATSLFTSRCRRCRRYRPCLPTSASCRRSRGGGASHTAVGGRPAEASARGRAAGYRNGAASLSAARIDASRENGASWSAQMSPRAPALRSGRGRRAAVRRSALRLGRLVLQPRLVPHRAPRSHVGAAKSRVSLVVRALAARRRGSPLPSQPATASGLTGSRPPTAAWLVWEG
jgi:hypothetical protein